MKCVQIVILLLTCSPCSGMQQQLASLSVELELLAQHVPLAPPAPPKPTPSTFKYTVSSLREALKTQVDDKGLESIDTDDSRLPTIIEKDEFLRVITECARIIKGVHQKNTWVTVPGKESTLPSDAYNLAINYFARHAQIPFYPHTQKMVVEDDSVVLFWGDTHGSASSLARCLESLVDTSLLNDDFKIIEKNAYMVFLGDCTDRGAYGVEVLYMLARLKIANPNSVVIVRGNHEDFGINMQYGFHEELDEKYKNITQQEISTVFNFYELLPVVLYVGCGKNQKNFIQCCHGALELGYLPHNLLNASGSTAFERIYELKRKTTFEKIQDEFKKSPPSGAVDPQKVVDYLQDIHEAGELSDFTLTSLNDPYLLGFLWHDFRAHPADDPVNDQYLTYNKSRGGGFIYGNVLTELFLKVCSDARNTVRAVLRAHQHNSSMQPELWDNKGILNLWDGLVFTFLSAPAPAHFNFNYDTFGAVNVHNDYDQWSLMHAWRDTSSSSQDFNTEHGFLKTIKKYQ